MPQLAWGPHEGPPPIAAGSGRRLWTFGAYPPDFDAADADWENGRILRRHALYRNLLVSVRDDGEVSCLDLKTGNTNWARHYDGKPGPTVAVFDEWIAYAEMQGGRALVRLLDPMTGEPRTAIETDIQDTPERVVITIDGRVNVLGDPKDRMGFEAAALTAVQQWKYEPATRDGQPEHGKAQGREDRYLMGLRFRLPGPGKRDG